MYVTVPFLLCFILYLRALFKYKSPGAHSEGPIHGGAIFGILRFVTIPSIALQTCVACILLGHYNSPDLVVILRMTKLFAAFTFPIMQFVSPQKNWRS